MHKLIIKKIWNTSYARCCKKCFTNISITLQKWVLFYCNIRVSIVIYDNSIIQVWIIIILLISNVDLYNTAIDKAIRNGFLDYNNHTFYDPRCSSIYMFPSLYICYNISSLFNIMCKDI